MSDLAPVPPAPLVPDDDVSTEFLASHAALTRRAYEYDLNSFARFGGFESIADAARTLFAAKRGDANRAAQRWISAMEAEGLASATIRRRCCALRALARFANRVGAVPWRLELPKVRVVGVRDVRGVSPEKFKRLLAEGDARERAIFDVLGSRGLRAAEAIGIQYPKDIELDARPPRIRIVGKGRAGSPTWIVVAEKTATHLRAWIAERGTEPGPLFGLKYVELLALCKAHGFRPHQLRHTAAVAAAKKTNGSLLSVAAFLRHASPSTSAIYCDNWKDAGGEVARLVADES